MPPLYGTTATTGDLLSKEVNEMERQGPLYTLLEASMDAHAKLIDAAAAQRRLSGMLEEAAKQARQEKRQTRGR